MSKSLVKNQETTKRNKIKRTILLSPAPEKERNKTRKQKTIINRQEKCPLLRIYTFIYWKKIKIDMSFNGKQIIMVIMDHIVLYDHGVQIIFI